MALPRLDDLLKEGVHGQRVFLRADLNVPLRDGVVGNDARIQASLPTLRKLLGAGARVALASHLGRPKGERKPEFSLRPVAPRLAERLGSGVSFCEACVGPEAERAVDRAKRLTQQLLTLSKGGAPIRRASAVSKLVREATELALSGTLVVARRKRAA